MRGQRRLHADYYKANDHEAVAATLASFPHRWVVSYDYAPETLSLYRPYPCVVYDLYSSAADRGFKIAPSRLGETKSRHLTRCYGDSLIMCQGVACCELL